jgi:hypothetical protein
LAGAAELDAALSVCLQLAAAAVEAATSATPTSACRSAALWFSMIVSSDYPELVRVNTQSTAPQVDLHRPRHWLSTGRPQLCRILHHRVA